MPGADHFGIVTEGSKKELHVGVDQLDSIGLAVAGEKDPVGSGPVFTGRIGDLGGGRQIGGDFQKCAQGLAAGGRGQGFEKGGDGGTLDGVVTEEPVAGIGGGGGQLVL